MSSVNVLLDLVCWTGDHRDNTIKTFVNVFEKVFDTLNIGRHLDINMCIKHLSKVGVVGASPISCRTQSHLESFETFDHHFTYCKQGNYLYLELSPQKKLANNVSCIHHSSCKVHWGIISHTVRATNIL
jgi:hypothetical protein